MVMKSCYTQTQYLCLLCLFFSSMTQNHVHHQIKENLHITPCFVSSGVSASGLGGGDPPGCLIFFHCIFTTATLPIANTNGQTTLQCWLPLLLYLLGYTPTHPGHFKIFLLLKIKQVFSKYF